MLSLVLETKDCQVFLPLSHVITFVFRLMHSKILDESHKVVTSEATHSLSAFWIEHPVSKYEQDRRSHR